MSSARRTSLHRFTPLLASLASLRTSAFYAVTAGTLIGNFSGAFAHIFTSTFSRTFSLRWALLGWSTTFRWCHY